MPTIDVEYAELERLLGVTFNGDMEKLDELLSLVKSEVKLYNQSEGVVSIEIKDTNRPDLWSVEGLSRALHGFLNKTSGIRQYKVEESALEVIVDSQLEKIRPFICCSIVRNMKLTDAIIRGFMHIQDKLDQTYGRSRQKTSIGLYDYDLISPPLSYTVAKPKEISFIPLGFSEKMTLEEILEHHPKGIEYGHIVKKHMQYPILLDSKRKVLSFPPIINSNDLGQVTEETKNLLVEVTGTTYQTVLNTLNLVTLALTDRGGEPHSATVRYMPKDERLTTPNFDNKTMDLEIDYVQKILDLPLDAKQIEALLLRAGFGVEKTAAQTLKVLVPCYRVDVMHSVDLIEDIAIAFGYNNIKPLWRDLPTTGHARPEQRLINLARDFMIGLGFQEILSYSLTSPESLFVKMNRENTRIVEITNPKILTMTCLRNWLLPSVMEFLSNNTSVEFPQKIFELGKVTLLDAKEETKTRDEERLATVTSHPTASFTEIKSALDAFLMNLGVNWQISETFHPSFIEGRVGSIIIEGANVGVVGEINPTVLENWKLENPVAAFEINMRKIARTV